MQQSASSRGPAVPRLAVTESGRQPYFLMDIIEVKLEYMQQFVLMMRTRLLDVFESFDWKLISATYYLTGRPEVVMHIWQIPSADSLRETMVKLSESSDYLTLQEYIVSEQQHLLSRMMYDPTTMPAKGRALSAVESALLAGATEALGLRVTGAAPAYAAGGPPEAISTASLTGHMVMDEARTPGDRAAESLGRAAERIRSSAETFRRGGAVAPRIHAAVERPEARPLISAAGRVAAPAEEARTPGDRATDVLRRATEGLGRGPVVEHRAHAVMERPEVMSSMSSKGHEMKKKKIDSAALEQATSDTGRGPKGVGLMEEDLQAGAQAPSVQLGPEDLVICADDGKFYTVSKETYMASPLPENLEDLPRTLLELGSVITTVNPGVFPGTGSACYILNLPLIRKPELP